MIWVVGILGLVILAVGVFYLVLPLVMWRSVYFDPTAVREVQPEEVDPEAARYFKAVTDAFAQRGFAWLGDARVFSSSPHVYSDTRVFVNRASCTLARACRFCVSQPNEDLSQSYVTVGSRLVDGRGVTTANPRDVPTEDEPGQLKLFLPEVRDPVALLDLHEAVVRVEAAGSALKAIPEHPDAASLLKAIATEMIEDSVRQGTWQRGGMSTRYTPTLRGIYPIVIRQLPPFRGLYRRRVWSRSRRVVQRVHGAAG